VQDVFGPHRKGRVRLQGVAGSYAPTQRPSAPAYRRYSDDELRMQLFTFYQFCQTVAGMLPPDIQQPFFSTLATTSFTHTVEVRQRLNNMHILLREMINSLQPDIRDGVLASYQSMIVSCKTLNYY
jgi:hypothetical protein